MLVAIDTPIKLSEIDTTSLSKLQRKHLNKALICCDIFRSYGFQEVVGYNGQKTIVSFGGHWSAGVRVPKVVAKVFSQLTEWTDTTNYSKFIVTSYGYELKGEHVYTQVNGSVTIAEIKKP